VAKLLGVENIGGRIQRDYLHVGDDGKEKITTVTTQDVEPIIRATKMQSDASLGKRGFLRFKANIPFTLIEGMCKASAPLWGVSVREAFSEVMQGKTDRAQRLIRTITEGRDYRKLQAEKDSLRYVKVPDGA
jgi:hypothetical protein